MVEHDAFFRLLNLVAAPCLPFPGAPAAPAGTDAAARVAAAVAKAAQVASRFGVEVAPGPAAAAVTATPSLAIGTGAGGAAFKPAPLRLDALGREVDEFGNLIAKTSAVGV
jgi:hypothetical protein